mmetsp:Transcript_12179/g.37903  ORF Transcript_12179/g.37903 Transcript_12179/m.37903 type:complete len:300 (-) Transcript_12179:50-949(-)
MGARGARCTFVLQLTAQRGAAVEVLLRDRRDGGSVEQSHVLAAHFHRRRGERRVGEVGVEETLREPEGVQHFVHRGGDHVGVGVRAVFGPRDRCRPEVGVPDRRPLCRGVQFAGRRPRERTFIGGRCRNDETEICIRVRGSRHGDRHCPAPRHDRHIHEAVDEKRVGQDTSRRGQDVVGEDRGLGVGEDVRVGARLRRRADERRARLVGRVAMDRCVAQLRRVEVNPQRLARARRKRVEVTLGNVSDGGGCFGRSCDRRVESGLELRAIADAPEAIAVLMRGDVDNGQRSDESREHAHG